MSSGNKSDRIIEKARNKILNGEYYEAHQLYRTLYYRYINSRRYNDLEELLYDGAKTLLNKEQYNSGSDLALLYIDTIKVDSDLHGRLVNDKNICEKITQKISDLLRLMPEKSQDRLTYICKTLQLNSEIFPLYLINYQFALIFWNEKNYSESRIHFMQSTENSSEDCALMLIEYHITCGFKSEVDLFIAQFILQLLSISNKRKLSNSSNRQNLTIQGTDTSACSSTSSRFDSFNSIDHSNSNVNSYKDSRSLEHRFADRTLRCFTAKHPDIKQKKPPFLLPLLNFLWLLLLAIESGKSTIFKKLCELYDPSLKRDPNYKEYLEKIGEIYFGLKTPNNNKRMGGLFGNLLQSLFDSDDDNESQSPCSSTKNARSTISEEVD